MIKFRGVNIFGNEWLYGNLVKIEENRYSILPEINDMPTCKCIADYDVNHNTIGRFTVSIRPRACFFPLFSFLPLWLHYNLNPLCVQY